MKGNGKKHSSVLQRELGDLLFDTDHKGPKHLVTWRKRVKAVTVHIISCGTFDAAEIISYRRAETAVGCRSGSKAPGMQKGSRRWGLRLCCSSFLPAPGAHLRVSFPRGLLEESLLPDFIQGCISVFLCHSLFPKTMPATLPPPFPQTARRWVSPALVVSLHGTELLPWEDHESAQLKKML